MEGESECQSQSQSQSQSQPGSSGSVVGSKVCCWVCGPKNHKEERERLITCGKCQRSYHEEPCLTFMASKYGYPDPVIEEEEDKDKGLLKCSECLAAESTTIAKLKESTEDEVRTVLVAFCDRIVEYLDKPIHQGKYGFIVDAKKNCWPDDYDRMTKVIPKLKDMKTIEEMLMNKEIRTVEGFAGEVHWIVINSCVFYGATEIKTELSQEFEELCFGELDRILSSCLKCQIWRTMKPESRPAGWITEPCKEPHAVVWAKISGQPCIPAKVIGAEGELVEVIFFGDHGHSIIPLYECMQYATVRPTFASCWFTWKEKYQTALEEVSTFLDNISQVPGFGRQATPDVLKTFDEEEWTKDVAKMLFPQATEDVLERMASPPLSLFRRLATDRRFSVS